MEIFDTYILCKIIKEKYSDAENNSTAFNDILKNPQAHNQTKAYFITKVYKNMSIHKIFKAFT